MRSLKRNQQKMYYALYVSNQPVYKRDASGNIIYTTIDGKQVPVKTGSTTSGYTAPVEFWANISTCKGQESAAVFGQSLDYTRSIYTTDMSLPITGTSRIWFETAPKLKTDGTADGDSADYTVVQVAKALNSIMYAIKSITKAQ